MRLEIAELCGLEAFVAIAVGNADGANQCAAK
jgi:hypothetical protein